MHSMSKDRYFLPTHERDCYRPLGESVESNVNLSM